MFIIQTTYFHVLPTVLSFLLLNMQLKYTYKYWFEQPNCLINSAQLDQNGQLRCQGSPLPIVAGSAHSAGLGPALLEHPAVSIPLLPASTYRGRDGWQITATNVAFLSQFHQVIPDFIQFCSGILLTARLLHRSMLLTLGLPLYINS